MACAQHRFGLPPLGEVARNLGKADQLAGTVPDRVDDDIGPELRPVLADAPTFLFEFAGALGDFEGALGESFRAIFLGVEAREILADDFGLLVSLETLGARIPARDRTVGVEHVDRIVGDRVDEHAVAAFAGLRGLEPFRMLHASSPHFLKWSS